MLVPDWIWFVFIFAFGCCIGSFLNVVIYRLPRNKSLITPPSSCPACGKLISFYDNIPLVSWLILRRKCRNCKAPISPRYFIVELLTGLIFTGFFFIYFYSNLRTGIGSFLNGGWFIYLMSIILVSAFIAASAIDLELWVIPISICWFVTAAGFAGSAIGVYIIDISNIRGFHLLPSASADTAAMAMGAAIGLFISWVFLRTGLIKISYESEKETETNEQNYNHRLEMCKEILFLLPVIIFLGLVLWLSRFNLSVHSWWVNFSQIPAIAGLLGSFWGYLAGCAVVWVTRILGTLGFGKEAMGLGDVHLMGAAGAIIGWQLVIIAFFVAPFLGLAWAAIQMISVKSRQIPYGPFLSLAVIAVMILHDRIFSYIVYMFYNTR